MDTISKKLIALALREDIGPGDVTSALIPADAEGEAHVVAKQDLVFAGMEAFEEVFRQVDSSVDVRFFVAEGQPVAPKTIMGRVEGLSRSILASERTALNLLQRLSGIATFTRRCADALEGTKTRVVDTRKTTPGLRALEKHAVRVGGGSNHRFGLFDGVLIKDNHIAAIGGVRAAIAEAKKQSHHLMQIECEVTTPDELDEALDEGCRVLLLDNMSLADMTECVRRNAGRAVLEASGNMTLERLPSVAKTGVDLISMGALTHTVAAADISLEWVHKHTP